jgi:hypothetical protein
VATTFFTTRFLETFYIYQGSAGNFNFN